MFRSTSLHARTSTTQGDVSLLLLLSRPLTHDADMILVQCTSGSREKAAVNYSISQMILDVAGDLMSKFVCDAFDEYISDPRISRLHSDLFDMEDTNSMDPEISPGMLTLPYGGNHYNYHHPCFWDPMAWRTRFNLGSIFSDHCCGNRNDLDSGVCVPCTICFSRKRTQEAFP